MNHLYQFPGVCEAVAAGRGGIQSLGAPGYIVDPAQWVDVQDVEVGGTVEEERDESKYNFPKNSKASVQQVIKEDRQQVDSEGSNQHPSDHIDEVDAPRYVLDHASVLGED